MKTVKQSLTIFGVLVLSLFVFAVAAPRTAQAVSAALVQVTNTMSNPVPVRSADNPALQPFGTRVYPSASTTGSFTVPAGKRLVIQQVSAFSFGSTTVEDVAIYTTTAGNGTAILLPFTINVHGIVYTGAQQIVAVADPGSTVTVAIDDTNFADNAGMNVDIKGYYVDVP